MRKRLLERFGIIVDEKWSRDEINLKEARLTLADLGAPYVVTGKTYFWAPGRSSKDRRGRERWATQQVVDWLEKLDKEFDLGLEIEWVNNTVKVWHEGEQIAYFSYEETGSHVYRHQDFRELINLVTDKIGKAGVEKIKRDIMQKRLEDEERRRHKEEMEKYKEWFDAGWDNIDDIKEWAKYWPNKLADVAYQWYKAGFSAYWAYTAFQNGWRDIEVLKEWVKVLGKDAYDSYKFYKLGVSPEDVKKLNKYYVLPSEYESFLDSGIDDIDTIIDFASNFIWNGKKAKAWIDAGFTAKEAGQWNELNFTPEEAKEWAELGYSPEEAEQLRSKGYKPEDVANKNKAIESRAIMRKRKIISYR